MSREVTPFVKHFYGFSSSVASSRIGAGAVSREADAMRRRCMHSAGWIVEAENEWDTEVERNLDRDAVKMRNRETDLYTVRARADMR